MLTRGLVGRDSHAGCESASSESRRSRLSSQHLGELDICRVQSLSQNYIGTFIRCLSTDCWDENPVPFTAGREKSLTTAIRRAYTASTRNSSQRRIASCPKNLHLQPREATVREEGGVPVLAGVYRSKLVVASRRVDAPCRGMRCNGLQDPSTTSLRPSCHYAPLSRLRHC